MEQDDNVTGSGSPIVVNIAQIHGLQKELGEGQEGEETGAGGGGEKSLNNAIFQDPAEKALTNAVILLNIFSHLEFDALVNLRLVCKVWDEAVRRSPEFRKTVYIDVQRLFPCCTIAHVPNMNPNLVKNIYVTDRCTNENEIAIEIKGSDHDTKQRADAAAYNLTTFLSRYNHYVENILFDGRYCDSFHTYLVKALNALDFTKLHGIKILDMFNTGSFGYYWGWRDYKDDLISTVSTSSSRPNLTSLQLDHTVAGSPFHDIFQKLINCAPNLENIEINGNFYPDLSTCKNLKVLNYAGIPYYYNERKRVSEERSFNLESLSRMLDQAKHSLIKLTVQDSYLDCVPSDVDGHSQLEEFKFPDVMKKLESLCIDENDGKPFFQPELKKLNPDQFPKLKRLSIGVKNLDNVLEGISHSFVTISSLGLCGTISPNIMQRIPIIFPNLTSLTTPWSVGLGDEEPNFDAVIDFCSGWKIQKLEIGIALQSDWSAFMKGLGRLKQNQTDIRMLELPSQNNASGEELKPAFELWYDARQQQQAIGTMNVDIGIGNLSFGPHSMKEGMEGAVLEFILKHPLKVHFI